MPNLNFAELIGVCNKGGGDYVNNQSNDLPNNISTLTDVALYDFGREIGKNE